MKSTILRFSFLLLSLTLFSACTSTGWVTRFDSSDDDDPANVYLADDRVGAITVGADGNVYVAGVNGAGLLLIKYDGDGNETLLYGLSSIRDHSIPLNSNVVDMIIDQNGNIYITGTLGGDDLSEVSIFTIKVRASGDVDWYNVYDQDREYDSPVGLALDSGDNVIVAGVSQERVDTTDELKESTILLKYLPDGQMARDWPVFGPKYLVGSGLAHLYAMAVDGDNNIYLAGLRTKKYDKDGKLVCTTETSTSSASSLDVGTDHLGNFYIATYQTSRSLGTDNQYYGHHDYLVKKYSPICARLWSQAFVGPDHDMPSQLIVDWIRDSVIITGSSCLSRRRESTDNTCHGGFASATLAYDLTGNLRWTHISKDAASPVDLAVDGAGNVYLLAQTYNDIVLYKYTQRTGAPERSVEHDWYFKPDLGEGALACCHDIDYNSNIYVAGLIGLMSGPFHNTDIVTSKIIQTPVNGTDINIHKQVSAERLEAGENVVYTIEVSNAGPTVASNVAVIDALPPFMQFVTATATQGECSHSLVVTCELGDLANGAGVTITITAKAINANKPYKWLTNGTAVVSDTADLMPGNNMAFASTLLSSDPDDIGPIDRCDLDSNGVVDDNDIAIVEGCLGQNTVVQPECAKADLFMMDGVIDNRDLSVIQICKLTYENENNRPGIQPARPYRSIEEYLYRSQNRVRPTSPW